MSKTFKSAFEDSNYRLEVCKNAGAEHISLWIVGGGSDSASIAVAHKDMPALALAILEAAGVVHHDPDDTPYEESERTENMGALNMSAFYLAKHVNDAEKAEFLAKDQAKLEAEALELLNSGIGATFKSWPEAVRTNQPSVPNWLAVARRAREINKEDNSGRE